MEAHRRFSKWLYPPAKGRIEAGKPYLCLLFYQTLPLTATAIDVNALGFPLRIEHELDAGSL
jgi:hypothetical protein